jgi:hypothetical protein
MKRVSAQFSSPWQPTRALLAGLSALVACAATAVGGTAWERHRVAGLGEQVSRLAETDRMGAVAPVPSTVPPYDASARQFLRERGAAWAPMLRALESGAMVGVTPTALEFDTSTGVSRAELDYSDSTALLDYLGRIDEGVAPRPGSTRWKLSETRVQQGPSSVGTPVFPGSPSQAQRFVATISSVWQAPADVATHAAP